MKQFFQVLFGGLTAVITGVVVAYLGSLGWHFLRPYIISGGTSAISRITAFATDSDRGDGTSISGLTRTIRYSALEEEDLINAAAESLPSSADKRVTAASYIVKNLTRGDITIEEDPDKLQPIASLTKLVTAEVARKLIAPDKRMTITRDIMSTYGNTADFRVDETFAAGDLLYPLLMVSSNDAAEAYAREYGRKQFIEAMNEFVQSIGAYRSYFADPSGLSRSNVSTAHDMTIILDWIRKNDQTIMDITKLKTKTVRSHTWINPTHFLNWSDYLGGKNGYTPEANRTAAALFSLGPRKNVYAVVVLGSDMRDADVVKLLGKVRD